MDCNYFKLSNNRAPYSKIALNQKAHAHNTIVLLNQCILIIACTSRTPYSRLQRTALS